MRAARYRYHNLKRKTLLFLAVGILGTLLFFALRGSWHMLERVREAHALRGASEANLSRLVEREGELRAAVSTLESPRGVEAEVRKRFGVAKPGEGVIEIIEGREEGDTEPSPRGWLERLFDWF